MHLLTQVLIEDKAQDIIPKIVRIHLTPESICDAPKFLFK